MAKSKKLPIAAVSLFSGAGGLDVASNFLQDTGIIKHRF